MNSLAVQPPESGPPQSLAPVEATRLHAELDPAWKMADGALTREYTLADFPAALAFVNRVGEVAESLGHHPDIAIHGWNNVRLDISTHDIGGLSKTDFILAAQVDALR